MPSHFVEAWDNFFILFHVKSDLNKVLHEDTFLARLQLGSHYKRKPATAPTKESRAGFQSELGIFLNFFPKKTSHLRRPTCLFPEIATRRLLVCAAALAARTHPTIPRQCPRYPQHRRHRRAVWIVVYQGPKAFHHGIYSSTGGL